MVYDLAEGDSIANAVQKTLAPKQSGIIQVPMWCLKLVLTGGIENAFAVSEQNPFGVDVIITRAIVDITTLSATASCVLDVDIDVDGATGGDDILDGVPVGSGDAVGLFDSLNATDNGTNGEGKSWLWAKAGGGDDFITAKFLAAAGAAVAGELFLYCHPAE